MLKKIIGIFTMVLVLLVVNEKVLAKDEQTATSTINGVTVNWEYKLNNSNQIEELVCTNPNDLTGDINIPSTLDGKKVITIGTEAFNEAKNITGVTIPDSIEKIGVNAFKNCTKLSSVNLGKVKEFAGNGIFANCTSLKSIVIPKTLTKGYIYIEGAFRGCTNFTSITFEDGITKIPEGILMDAKTITKVTIPSSVTEIGSYAFANSGLTEINIPDLVEKIGTNAFKNCTKLSNVNLGKVKEFAGNGIFANCTSLKSIVIPKTLTTGYIYFEGAFSGCTNFTSITFEEGITKIPEGILMDAKTITKVTIPSSVTEIGSYAFANSGLTEITIPNKVTDIGISAFEGTKIEEVKIPTSVKHIAVYAFRNCSKLVKATILDNVERMGYLDTPTDYDDVFTNHNKDLTIYCYENSDAAEYAIKNNIKYVYLKRPTTGNDTNKEPNQPNQPNQPNPSKKPTTDDTTVAKGELPQTGVSMEIIFVIVLASIVSIILYKKYYNYKDIK